MQVGQAIEQQIKKGTLIDEHVYVPAKFLWAVIVAVVSFLAIFGGAIFWLASVKAEQQAQSEKLKRLEGLEERVIRIETLQVEMKKTLETTSEDVKKLLTAQPSSKVR